MIFNAEENELLACYMPVDDRLALIKAIVKDTADMDEEIRLIAESAVDKLARMSDIDFIDMAFCMQCRKNGKGEAGWRMCLMKI